MICPTCRSPMIVVEYKKIELDYCDNCKGVWFDSGELELMLGSIGLPETKAVLEDLLNSPPASVTEKKRRCPICRRPMNKVNVGGPEHVVIDTCVRHDGIWFDGGEVDHLVQFLATKTPDESRAGKTFNFIKDVFQAK